MKKDGHGRTRKNCSKEKKRPDKRVEQAEIERGKNQKDTT
jgi:hypothetical protein